MMEIIASRGFVNDNDDQLSFFIEDNGLDISLMIEHYRAEGKDKIIKLKISKEVLQELKIMCDATLEQLDGRSTFVSSSTFKKYL